MIAGNGEAPRISGPSGVVYVVDADESVRRSLRLLMETLGMDVETFSCAEGFLDRLDPGQPGCLITELDLPGMSGIDLQQHLKDQGMCLPVIVLASNADVRHVVRALHLGALDFIEKPFVDQVLLARVRGALGPTDLPAETTA